MVEITDEEIKSLTRAILTRYDLDFSSYEIKSFKRRVARTLSVFEIGTVHELWMKLLRERDFIYPFIDELTVGLTSMFRDPKMWYHLKMQIFRRMPSDQKIKIWHAGCSTGEEVYTMGIALRESGMTENARLLATDINGRFIRESKEGRYHIMKKEEYCKNYKEFNPMKNLDSYITEEDREIILDPTLIENVEFRHHNLVKDPSPGKFDIILCRNVMIYFDGPMKEKLLNMFYESLNEGGYFIIGFYDVMLPLLKSKFHLISQESKIFQKIAKADIKERLLQEKQKLQNV